MSPDDFNVARLMPVWEHRRTCNAARIIGVTVDVFTEIATVTVEAPGYPNGLDVPMPAADALKGGRPSHGDYLRLDEDGVLSWWTKEYFRKHYTPVPESKEST